MVDFFIKYTEIVIFDTEFTSWPGAMERHWSGSNEHREIVQIAAQKINLTTEVVVDSFMQIIRPAINPILSEYFVTLTGLTQALVDQEGIDFNLAYEQFEMWSAGLPIFSYAKQLGEHSDRGVLEENIQLYNLSHVLDSGRYDTLTAVFQAANIDTNQFTSGELYRAFDLPLEGHVHNAMHDVDSLVASLFALKKLNNVQ